MLNVNVFCFVFFPFCALQWFVLVLYDVYITYAIRMHTLHAASSTPLSRARMFVDGALCFTYRIDFRGFPEDGWREGMDERGMGVFFLKKKYV